MTSYHYYIVENNFAARVNRETMKAERLMADGKWLPYADVWDVCTNGRYLRSEREAREEAKEILDLRGVEHNVTVDGE